MSNLPISNQTRWIEITAVLLTGICKLICVDLLQLKFVFIIATILFWSVYLFRKISADKTLVSYWGLSLKNSSGVFKLLSMIGIPLAVLFVLYAYYQGTLTWKWNVVFVVITYPIWGLVQQFLMMSLFAGNLNDMEGKKRSPAVIILATAVVFSMVHFPSVPLVVATFFMALFYAYLFLRHRKVVPLGIFHGVLGGLFYYYVLDRDAWAEFVKMIAK